MHIDKIPIMQHMRCNLFGKGGVGDYTLKCEANLAMVKTVQLKNVLKLFVVFLIVPLPEIYHWCKYKVSIKFMCLYDLYLGAYQSA